MSLVLEFKKTLLEEPKKWEQIFWNFKTEYPHLEKEEFEKNLLKVLTILDKFESWKTIEIHKLTEIIFTKTLEMVAKRVLGENSQYPTFFQRWKYFLKSLGNSCFQHFSFLFTYLPNAILNLEKEKKFQIYVWVQKNIQIFKLCENETELLQAGFVLAWICGLARYRNESLKILPNLPLKILNSIFEIELNETNKKLFISCLEENPWANPKFFFEKKAEPEIHYHVAGGYAGLDGIFLHPPIFYNNHPNILTDGEQIFEVYADFFGINFVAISKENINSINTKSKLSISIDKNKIIYAEKSFLLPAFPENFIWKTNQTTFYIISELTNYVIIGGFENAKL